MNILIVDDSTMMRNIVKSTLTTFGANVAMEITEAANGEEALQKMESGKIDLVLLDWQMPVLDGLGFVKKVRGSGNKTPILMITSVSAKDKVLEAGKAGVNSYVEKPVRPNELWEKIKEYVK